MPRISKGLSQAYQLQDFAFEALMALKAMLTGKDGKLKLTREDASAIVSLEKAWQGCQERISFHRRVPSPGSLRPKPEKKPTRRFHGPVSVWPIAPTAPTDLPAPPTSTDLPTPASVGTAAATPRDADVPCPVCHGARELRICGGNGTIPCGRCGGTGRQPAKSS